MPLLTGRGIFFTPLAYHTSINSSVQAPKTTSTTGSELFSCVKVKIVASKLIPLDQITSFLNGVTDSTKLKEIYNLLMIIDESTKDAYTTAPNVKKFHQNLGRIISRIVEPENLQITLEQLRPYNELAATFIGIGKHDDEGFDTFRGVFGRSLNTSSINELKNHIKTLLVPIVGTSNNLRTSKTTREMFPALLLEELCKISTPNNKESFDSQALLHSIIANCFNNGLIKNQNIAWDYISKAGQNGINGPLIIKLINSLKRQNTKIIRPSIYILFSKIFRDIILLCQKENLTADPAVAREIVYMKNFIHSFPLSLKHAHEHNTFKLNTYKAALLGLSKSHSISGSTKKEITKTIAEINVQLTYFAPDPKKSYILADKNSFNLHMEFRKITEQYFDDAGLEFEKDGDNEQYFTGESSSKKLTEDGRGAIDGEFPISSRVGKTTTVQSTLERSACSEFAEVSTGYGRDGKASKAIVNPFNVKVVDAQQKVISSQFQCGAVYSELSARQYVIKMLLDNIGQDLSQDTIYICDSRQLNNGSLFEYRKLAAHRNFITAMINELREKIRNKKITINNFEQWLKEDARMELTDAAQISKLKTLLFNSKKKIELLSFNFSAYGHIAGGTSTSSVKNLKILRKLVRNKLRKLRSEIQVSPPYAEELKIKFSDLNRILRNESTYLYGDSSLSTAMVIGDIFNTCNGNMSIACWTSKDRGSNATIYRAITSSIFEHRKEKYGDKANLSHVNFQLKDAEEKYIVQQIVWQSVWYLPTLLNSGVAGNKSFWAWLAPLIKQAFNHDRNIFKFFDEIRKYHTHAPR